jgi:hypothetical protein
MIELDELTELIVVDAMEREVVEAEERDRVKSKSQRLVPS